MSKAEFRALDSEMRKIKDLPPTADNCAKYWWKRTMHAAGMSRTHLWTTAMEIAARHRKNAVSNAYREGLLTAACRLNHRLYIAEARAARAVGVQLP